LSSLLFLQPSDYRGIFDGNRAAHIFGNLHNGAGVTAPKSASLFLAWNLVKYYLTRWVYN
jgi:hypothetical protein